MCANMSGFCSDSHIIIRYTEEISKINQGGLCVAHRRKEQKEVIDYKNIDFDQALQIVYVQVSKRSS